MNHTPENITELPPHGVFVFGSNMEGRHGKGASVLAKRKFGARQGIGVGLQGRSYALPTKRGPYEVLSMREIFVQFRVFLRCVAANPDRHFYLTKVGCGLSGYSCAEMANLLVNAAGGPTALIQIPNLSVPRDFLVEMLPG